MKLNSFKLGQRLGFGFGLVLLLTAIVAGLAYVRLEMCQDAMKASDSLAGRSLLAERWMLLSSASVAKSTTLAKSGFPPVLEAYLAPQLKAGTEEINELAKQLAAQVSSERGKAQLAKIDSVRKHYLEMRNEAFRKSKAHEPDAGAFIDGEMQQAAAAYIGELQELRNMQHTLATDTSKQTNADVDRAQALVLAAAAVCVALGAVLAWRITRSVTVPLGRAVAATASIAAGDLSGTIVADGRDEVADMLRGLTEMQLSLARIVGQVRTSTDGISTASSQIATGNADLSARTEQTAANLQQSAASIEEITGTVTQSAGAARTADELARTAAQVAGKGGELVSQVVSTMGEISDASRKIADITGVIDGIAFQTNILALNAAVEAARAGDQGRGFAVVAAEVRTLAQRSAAAAKEIGALIGRSTERVDAGARLVGDAGDTMRDIVSSVQRVSEVINEIVTAADEQSRGISEVNAAVARLDQMTQANAALVEESAAAAESLRGQAGSLATVVDTFRLR